MPRKRKPNSSSKQTPPVGGQRKSARSSTELRARQRPDGDWELVHPRCALERAEDIEEVAKMIAADELDVACDELRWLLNGCSDIVAAHKMLGELALLENDLPLARGHFGYAYQLGVKAMQRAGATGPLPYQIPANQAFHEAGKGLAYCLKQLEKPKMAKDVIERLLQCDPSDPLGVNGL